MSDSDIVVGGVVGGVAGALIGGKVGYDQGYQKGYTDGQKAGYIQGAALKERELQPIIQDLREQLEAAKTGKQLPTVAQLIRKIVQKK